MNLVDEAIFMRATIESAITQKACEMATENDLQELEENLNLQEFYLQKNNHEKIMELDNAFHKMMYKITERMQCYYMIRVMNIHYDRIRELNLRSFNPERIIKEHKEIFECLKNRDGEKARDAILKHLERHYNQENEIRKKYPEYFA